jgi:small GTP-binding protein
MVIAIDGPLAALRESEIRLLNDIAETLAEMGDSANDDRKRLMDVAQDLRDLFFLVVVIGEFNAGKSTFVNSLLGDDLLPIGITPTTEMIELIRYGDVPNRKPSIREDGIREWAHPNTGAPGVAIVDTPGTGSVFQRHENIAKSFLHRSDFVIFVLSAKRAFAETERIYLELAQNYGKKILLVLNQVDLIQPKEQTEVRRFVERQVEEMLNLRPLLFMVSAKEALNAAKSGQPVVGDPGGVEAIKAHLRGVFNEAPPAKQKLLAQLDMAERVIGRYIEGIEGKAALVTADTTKVREVQRELEQQAVGLDTQLKEARAEIDRVFEGMRLRGINFIDTNLSVRKLGRVPSRDALQSEFQEIVIGRALRDLNDATNGYINAVIDSSRSYWRGIIDRLNRLRELMEQELSGLDSGVYAEQRESLEDAIRIAEAELKMVSSGKMVGDIQNEVQTNMSGLMVWGATALTSLIITALAVLAPGPIIGAGAAAFAPIAIVTAPLALVTGFAAYRYYRRVSDNAKRDLNNRIDHLEKTYHSALDDLTQKERNRLTQYGKQVLTPVFSRLEVLANRYAMQQAKLREHQTQIATLRKGIEETR